MTVSFNGSMASFIIPIITGTLSTIGSLVILNIILQSTIKLGTTHHRIMASMSVFDIIASICMALSTLPMPSDTVFRNGRPMWGNKITCQTQGFLIIFGMCGGSILYTCLAWYMACKITFRMNDYTIRKNIEPYMLIVAITLAFSGAIFFLQQDLINPSFFDSFCFAAPYSEDCNDISSIDAWSDCVLGDEAAMNPYENSLIITTVIVTITVVLILVAMILIINTVCDRKKKFEKANKQISDTSAPLASDIFNLSEDDSTSNNHEQQYSSAEQNYSRVLILQALMYILAFFITWIFMILCILHKSQRRPIMETSKAVLLPLQGFWNMIIFVCDKAYLVRQVDPRKSWCQAVQNVFLRPKEIPMAFLTNLTMVEETRNTGEQELSQVSKNVEDVLIANGSVENIVASNEKNDTNFFHSTQMTKQLRRPGMLGLQTPPSDISPAVDSVGSSFEPIRSSSISESKISYSASRNVESLECSAWGAAFSDESID